MVEIPKTNKCKDRQMTFKEAKEKARQERIAKANTNADALAGNIKYINYVLDLEDEEAVVVRLDQVIARVNMIDTIVTNDGSKYAVNCYTLPEYIFGPVLSRLLALVHITPAMFTDTRKVEFSAITGISYLAFNKAATALGAPAYYNKGMVVDARPSDIEELNMALIYLCNELSIAPVKVTEVQLEKWFTTAELKAITKLEELTKAELLDENSEFTIED